MSDEPERLKLTDGWLDRNIEAAEKSSYEYLQARIRLLEQQLKTAREKALEEAAQEALKWPNTYDDPVSAHAELMTTARIAAAIRSLGEKE